MTKISIIKPSLRLGDFFLFIESYIFPFVFSYFIFDHIQLLYDFRIRTTQSLTVLMSGAYDLNNLINIAGALRNLLLISFNVLIVWGLIIRKKLCGRPESFSDIFYPFIGTFFFLFYNLVKYFPQRWNFYFIPNEWILFFVLFGYIIANIGIIISVFATYNLRDSFSIFVEVRQVINKGLYKYVRHPIYCGYLIFSLGFFLSNPRFYYLILTSFFILITIKRGRLEEQKIASVSDEYRSYMRNTPFIFPARFKKVKDGTISK